MMFNSFFADFFSDPFFRTSPPTTTTKGGTKAAAVATTSRSGNGGAATVRKVAAHLMADTAVVFPAPSRHQMTMAASSSSGGFGGQRVYKRAPIQILRQGFGGGSMRNDENRNAMNKNGGGRLAEDERWRNSLRRPSLTTTPTAAAAAALKTSYHLPAICGKMTSTDRSTLSPTYHHHQSSSSSSSSPSSPANNNNNNSNSTAKPTAPGIGNRAPTTTARARPVRATAAATTNNNKGQSTTRNTGTANRAHRPQPPAPVNREELVTQIAQELGCERHLVEMIEREVLQRKPNVQWQSIAGLKEAKSLLQEVVVLPNIVPEFFKGIRRPWKGVLLVGPPGTGKTLLAKAVATECKSKSFFNVTSSTLTSKYRGESEKLVRVLFHMARRLAPSIIFIDEVDALVGCSSSSSGGSDSNDASRRFQSELLIQMDGLQEEAAGEEGVKSAVLVLAASNHPWNVDEAFRRRFEKRIYIPLPDAAARQQMLELHLVGMKLDGRLDLGKIAKRLEGYSGADILSVCRDAAMMSLRRKIADKSTAEIRQLTKGDLEEPITAQDFVDAFKRCNKSVSSTDTTAFDAWIKEFGSF